MITSNYEKFPDSYDESSKRIINTASAVAKQSFFYVQETGYLKIIKSHKTKRRNLNSFLIVYVVGGSGTLDYDDKEFQLKKGQCFFIDCMKKHSYHSSENDPWELLWVHFNGATSKEYFEVFYTRENPVVYPADNMKTESLLRELISINEEHTHNSELMSSHIIVTLMTQVILGTKKKITEPSENAVLIKNYLREHFTEKITLDELSKELFLSKFYIEKEFKKHYGMTVFDYIISKRINLAKRLLRFTSKTIDEISAECGFSDQSYFNRQFKKSVGTTGTAFRRKWKN